MANFVFLIISINRVFFSEEAGRNWRRDKLLLGYLKKKTRYSQYLPCVIFTFLCRRERRWNLISWDLRAHEHISAAKFNSQPLVYTTYTNVFPIWSQTPTLPLASHCFHFLLPKWRHSQLWLSVAFEVANKILSSPRISTMLWTEAFTNRWN